MDEDWIIPDNETVTITFDDGTEETFSGCVIHDLSDGRFEVYQRLVTNKPWTVIQ